MRALLPVCEAVTLDLVFGKTRCPVEGDPKVILVLSVKGSLLREALPR